MTTAMLADDHAIMRQGLAQLLMAEMQVDVTGQAADGEALLNMMAADPPDVAIVDVSMPGPGVPTICQRTQDAGWPTRIIVLTMHQNADMARELVASGAAAFILKRSAFDDLRAALDAVLAGKTFVSPLIVQEFCNQPRPAASLTRRETDIVQLIAQGHTNKRIAGQLGISVKTVETHRARAMSKLGVHSSGELVRRAVELGILSPS